MTDSTLITYTDAQGFNLALMDWPGDEDRPPRGQIIIVHGLGEHAGRYDALAERLVQWGFAVRSYDQHGHGESSGKPGSLPTDSQLLDDLADLIDHTRVHLPAGVPLILLGHSMGGLVASRLVSLTMRRVDALVLSSPALDAGLSAIQKLLVSVLPRIAPDLRVGNGLDANYLSHDPVVIQAYRDDPLVHDRISARLARFIATEGPAVIAHASHWTVPTLLLWAGDDRLVNPDGSRRFAAAAPPEVVASRCFEGYYHEIFNETGREAVLDALKTWLDARF